MIPDGTSCIVQVTIKTELTLHWQDAEKHAQDVVVEIARRLSGKDEAFIRERITEQFWMDAGWQRPEEPPP